MKTFEKGYKFKSWIIQAVVAHSIFRTEYLLEPDVNHPGEELHAIVYDMQDTPECMVWNSRRYSKDPYEYSTPYELRFLSVNKQPVFPTMVRHGEEYPSHWAVVRAPKCVRLDAYLRANPPKDNLEAVKLVVKIGKALLQLGEFRRARHTNLVKSSVFVTDDGNIILKDLQHIAVDCYYHSFNRELAFRSLFLAPELFHGQLSANADVFSLSLILYSLVSGRQYPWNIPAELADGIRDFTLTLEDFRAMSRAMRRKRPDLSGVTDERLQEILRTGLAGNPASRYSDMETFVRELEEYIAKNPKLDDTTKKLLSTLVGGLMKYAAEKEGKKAPAPVQSAPAPKTGGFADLAGMDELKEELMWKFINPIRYKKLAKGFGITPPNGCLLYGPPGCGKTYCAEKIAEEAGINFRLCRPSEIASTYVHGGQELIKGIFDEARKKAPILLFWDEADAIATRRDMLHEHYASEVNELLAQMNNAAADGVYVFLACNFPEKLDPAILRRGRIDEQFYVPLPDAKGREDMFRLRTANLPKAGTWDYGYLAYLSDGFSYADLEYVITECRRTSFRMAVSSNAKRLTPVKQVVMEDIIKKTQPSLSRADRSHYEEVHNKMIGSGEPQRRKIGF